MAALEEQQTRKEEEENKPVLSGTIILLSYNVDYQGTGVACRYSFICRYCDKSSTKCSSTALSSFCIYYKKFRDAEYAAEKIVIKV